MKNHLYDLNNHLFAQIERLAEEGLSPEKIEQEHKRAAAMVGVSDQILRTAAVQLQGREDGDRLRRVRPAPIPLNDEGCDAADRRSALVDRCAAQGSRVMMLYTKEELAFIKRNRKLPRRELLAAFIEKFGRTITLDHLHRVCRKNRWLTGRGHVMPKGKIIPGGERHLFGKGRLPPQTKHLGYEYVDPAGFVWISVQQVSPSGFERTMVRKHKWFWEKAHGPIPKGMVLKCKSDKSNCDPSNWDLVDRKMLPRLNGFWRGVGYDNAPPELKPTILAVAKLEHSIRSRPAGDTREAG